jgi:hypothetical protein
MSVSIKRSWKESVRTPGGDEGDQPALEGKMQKVVLGKALSSPTSPSWFLISSNGLDFPEMILGVWLVTLLRSSYSLARPIYLPGFQESAPRVSNLIKEEIMTQVGGCWRPVKVADENEIGILAQTSWLYANEGHPQLLPLAQAMPHAVRVSDELLLSKPSCHGHCPLVPPPDSLCRSGERLGTTLFLPPFAGGVGGGVGGLAQTCTLVRGRVCPRVCMSAPSELLCLHFGRQLHPGRKPGVAGVWGVLALPFQGQRSPGCLGSRIRRQIS